MAFFPDPQKQGDIKFYIAKSLPYILRMTIVMIFIIAGVLIQAFLSFWLGLVLVVCGTGLSLIKGYQPIPKTMFGTEKWDQVTPNEYKKIKFKEEQIDKWDTDAFDVTNPRGLIFFIFICSPIIALLFFAPAVSLILGSLTVYVLVDIAVILVPHWVTGIRNYLKKDKLIIKINILEKIMDMLSAPSDVQVLPMLSTLETKEGKRVPEDARLMLKFLNAPADFLGVQVQLSINSVQGTDYPYLYCVVLAKKEEKLFNKKSKIVESVIGATNNVISETQTSEDVDVLVIRQFTTKTSGYHTDLNACKNIVNASVNLARKLIK